MKNTLRDQLETFLRWLNSEWPVVSSQYSEDEINDIMNEYLKHIKEKG